MVRIIILVILLCVISGCGQGDVSFSYPDEQLTYPVSKNGIPTIYIAGIMDLRPEIQRNGHGVFADLVFPSDRNWKVSVPKMYRDALSKDLTQTSIASLTYQRDLADYILEAEILSFHCYVDRSLGSFALPAITGSAAGLVWGDDANSILKRAAASWVISMVALPLPVKFQAQVEVGLILRDRDNKIIWQENCIGQIDEDMWMPASSRKDKELAESKLPLAVKKCNACLLGQLRQFLN